MRRSGQATTAKAAPSVVAGSPRDAMANDFGIGNITQRRRFRPFILLVPDVADPSQEAAPLISLSKIGVEPISSRHSLRAPRRRARCPGGLGLVLAAIALLLQVAVPILHSPVLVGSAGPAGDLATGFDEHALCLAQGRGDP